MNVIGSCMGWVPTCWRELRGLFSKYTTVADKSIGLPDLPNSIIEYIFLKSSPIIIQQFIPKFVSDGNMELYFIDAESSHDVGRVFFELDACYMQKDHPLLLLGSYDGFLLFTNTGCSMYMQGPPVFYAVWNPITKQKAIFRPPSSRLRVCAFYFCSVRREYVLLFVSKKGAPFKFKLYNLGTKLWENVGNFSYPPFRDTPPVILNKTLYWVVDQCSFWIAKGCSDPSRSRFVLSFESDTKKFGTIGYDGLAGRIRSRIRSRFELCVHLFELEQELYICDFSAVDKLELSVLNQGTKCWVKKHTVILPMDDFYTRKLHYGSDGSKFVKEVFPYKKGELLVRDDERLLIYDIHSNTCRFVGNKGRSEDSSNFQIAVHNYSLASF